MSLAAKWCMKDSIECKRGTADESAHMLQHVCSADSVWKACMLTYRHLQCRRDAAQTVKRSPAHLVDTRHHGKDGRVCDGGGGDPRCSQLPGVLMPPISRCPLSHHHLHAGPALGALGTLQAAASCIAFPAMWLASSRTHNTPMSHGNSGEELPAAMLAGRPHQALNKKVRQQGTLSMATHAADEWVS